MWRTRREPGFTGSAESVGSATAPQAGSGQARFAPSVSGPAGASVLPARLRSLLPVASVIPCGSLAPAVVPGSLPAVRFWLSRGPRLRGSVS